MRATIQGLLLGVLALLLVSCSDFYNDAPPSREVKLQIATPTEPVGGERLNKPLATAYPNLSKVTLSFAIAGYTAATLNSEFNSNQFTVDTALDAFVLTDTEIALKVPRVNPITFTVTAYVQSGGVDVQFFKGETTLSEGDVAAIESGSQTTATIELKSDISTTIPRRVTTATPCTDSDGDTLCDGYEDLFKNSSGVADVDNDGTLNSLDSDSDGDGIVDATELLELTNSDYPQFIYRNRPIISVSGSLVTAKDMVSGSYQPLIEDDMGDQHTFILTTPPLNGEVVISGSQIRYNPNSGYEGSDSFTLTATDRAGNSQTGTITVTVGEFSVNPNWVSTNNTNSFVVKSNGTLWSWGESSYYLGHAGDGLTAAAVQKTSSPESTLTGVVSVAASSRSNHTLALLNDGTIYSWGYGYYGQLGQGSGQLSSNYPAPVLDTLGTAPLGGVVSIFSGDNSSFAVTADGLLWGWGLNSYGQLGNGKTANSPLPVKVVDAAGLPFTGVKSVAVAQELTFAVKQDGTVWYWGRDYFKPFTITTSVATSTQTATATATSTATDYCIDTSTVTATSTATATATSTSTATTQTVTITRYPTQRYPVPLKLADGTAVSGIKQITTFEGYYSGQFLALLHDGTMKHFQWSNQKLTVTAVTDSSGAVFGGVESISQSSYGSYWLAKKSDGTLWAWGSGSSGQLGSGTVVNFTPYPLPVVDATDQPLVGVKAVAAGQTFGVALLNDDTIVSWGENSGQLGSGESLTQFTPTPILSQEESPFTGLKSLEAGYYHTVALKEDGTLWAWGYNSNGQLGSGSYESESLPVPVVDSAGAPIGGVSAISSYSDYTLALAQDGTVWAWGSGYSGQLGAGTEATYQSHAVKVLDSSGTAPLSSITALFTGQNSSFALDASGVLWSWGSNTNGELGNGTRIGSHLPVQVVNSAGEPLMGVIAVAPLRNRTVALMSDHSIWWWGLDLSTPITESVDRVDCTTGEVITETVTTYGYRAPAPLLDSSGSAVTGVAAVGSSGDSSLDLLLQDGTLATISVDGYSTGILQMRNNAFGQPVSGVSELAGSSLGTHTLFSRTDGSLWGVGSNYSGELAISNSSSSWFANPVAILAANGTPLTGVVNATVGLQFSGAVLSSGEGVMWGGNSHGQLGNGRLAIRDFAAPVVESLTTTPEVTVMNQAPLFTSTPPSILALQAPLSYAITTRDAENHYREISLIRVTPDTAWAVPLAITDLNWAAGTATLTGAGAPAGLCSVAIELGVYDGQGGTARQSFNLNLCGATGASNL